MEKFKKAITSAVIFIIILAAAVTVLYLPKNRTTNGIKTQGEFSDVNDLEISAGSSMEPMQKMALGVNSVDSAESIMNNEVDNKASSMADKKIVKNGNLSLKVDSANDALARISQIAKDSEGDVQSSNFYQNTKNIKNGTVTVKVPVANFEKTFQEIKGVATLVVRESTSGQDVTEEYSDLQAQLKNKQAEEQSFLRILDMSGKISDILAVTNELSRVRGQIERLQGRIKIMDSQTSMSTIIVKLTEDVNVTFSDSWRPWQVAKETFNALFKDIQGFINFLIVLVIRIIPIIIIYSLILGILFWVGKKIYFRTRG